MKSTRLCLACGNAFVPLLHVPHQRYCSSEACQRARRREWQNRRLRTDSDYRDNHTLPANGTARDYVSKLSATIRKAEGQLRNVEAFVRKARPEVTVHKVVITYGDLYAAETDQLFTTSADQFASDDPVYILCVDHLDRLVQAVHREQCRFASFFDDCTQRRRRPETRLLLLSDLLNEAPYLGPDLPAHLFAIYKPFYEKLLERAQPKQKAVDH
ncbi:hypothetical protein WCQ02_06615 [Paraburkholderia tropica]|uniref:hypothetical protein n=1 Tax=Paraburkholderia tropica TaxID=92647 RepID=UPI003016E712